MADVCPPAPCDFLMKTEGLFPSANGLLPGSDGGRPHVFGREELGGVGGGDDTTGPGQRRSGGEAGEEDE